MAHELIPRNGQTQTAKEVVRLLRSEFAYVKTDSEDGLKQAKARAEWIERAPAHIFLGRHAEALENAAKLRRLLADEVLTIEFGDDASKVLKTTVVPGDTIKFGYRSDEEQADMQRYVDRCARVLDCEIEII